MAKYKVWDKESNVYTPIGEILTPEEWIVRYGWINNPVAIPVVAGGIINGAFCGELSEMVGIYTKCGVDFSSCTTSEEILALIEDYEDNPPVSTEISTDERIAAALEAQVMLAMPDEEIIE